MLVDNFVNKLSEVPMKLGGLLRKKREELGLSTREQEFLLNMDHSFISKMENGLRFPSDEYLPRLADFLGISVNELAFIIADDKAQARIERINEGPSLEAIEAFAAEDRNTFFSRMGRDYFNFPKDWKRIPKVVFNLDVLEDDTLFSADRTQIYAGLFPEGHLFQGESSVIVIATDSVVRGRTNPSVKTKLFHALHEMGHFRLHWPTFKQQHKTLQTNSPLYCSSGDNSPMEQQASNYAGAFLISRTIISQVLGGRRFFDMQRHSRELCEQLFVEPWMLRKRLKVLRINVIG